ncbi:MAG: metallopeptidase TldD-related protein [Candidatus Riflebacteria bacterium]|nr:metallopeptidase TldD-related protein [Candidatus Riflebacteria bacterium]
MREKLTQTVKQTSLSIVQNEIQAVRRKNISKTGCRVIKDGKIGVAGGLGEVNSEELYARAAQSLDYGIEYDVDISENLQHRTQLDSLKISDSDLCNRISTLLKEIKARHPAFALSNKVNLSHVSLQLENERQLRLEHLDSYLSLSFLIKKQGSTGIMDTFFGLVDRQLDESRVVAAISEIIEAYDNIQPLPCENLPVIIGQSLLTRLFQRDLNGKMLGNKASLFQNQLGKKVFSENFSLQIAGDPVETFGPAFDMEGTITAENLSWLIQNGVITRPYTDKKTARRYGFENTGCADGNYDSVPSLGGANLEIKHSGRTLSELLNGRPGLMVQMASGGDFTPDGQFASPVQVAFLTDGRKLLGRVPEFTIKGSIFDFFGNDFIGLTSDKIYINGNDRMLVTRMAIEKL